jgi:hypothetical protein
MCTVIFLAVKPADGYRRFENTGCLHSSLQPDKGSQMEKQASFLNITHPSLSPADFFPENGDEELCRNDNHPQDSEASKA